MANFSQEYSARPEAQNPNSQVSGDADSGTYSAAMSRDAAALTPPASPVPTQASATPLPDFTYDLGGINPASDLSYNSFLRGYGYDSASARAQAARQRASLQAQLEGALPQFGEQLKEGLTDVRESAANRGATRSSSSLLSQDKVQRDVNSREAALRSGIADKQAQVTFGLEDALAGLERQKAEESLQARARLLEQQNQQIAYQRALQQLGMAE